MASRNDFSSLKNLPPDVLSELVREGELRLQAQLQQAIASDQRAMSWLTMVTGTATVALGAGLGLIISNRSPALVIIALIFALAMFRSATKAVDAVRPSKFCFPGNEPINWLPEYWEKGTKKTLQQARIEQAHILQGQIRDNMDWAARSADELRHSMAIAIWAIVLFGTLSWLCGMGRH